MHRQVGLGEIGEPGHPMQQGFDHFFGYLNQTHAHNYYPGFLFNGLKPLTLRNEVVLARPERGDVVVDMLRRSLTTPTISSSMKRLNS